MTRILLTFGDSNTYGTPPVTVRGTHARFDADTRWPRVVATHLGEGWDLVEEGLPGRTAQFEDPIMGAHMDGRTGLRIALQSQGPIDVLTVMLGTNDMKTRFAPAVHNVTAGIAALLDIALGEEMQTRHGGFRVLLVAPAPILEQGPFSGEFIGARDVSLGLAEAYQTLAAARSIGFFDAGSVVTSCAEDGIHLDAAAHRTLGVKIAGIIKAL